MLFWRRSTSIMHTPSLSLAMTNGLCEQKAEAIISQLLAPVRLLPAVDGNIWIGDRIQLRCPGVVWAAGGRCNQVSDRDS